MTENHGGAGGYQATASDDPRDKGFSSKFAEDFLPPDLQDAETRYRATHGGQDPRRARGVVTLGSQYVSGPSQVGSPLTGRPALGDVPVEDRPRRGVLPWTPCEA